MRRRCLRTRRSRGLACSSSTERSGCAMAKCLRSCSDCWRASPPPRYATRAPVVASSTCALTRSDCYRANLCLTRSWCLCWRYSPRFDGFMETPLLAAVLDYRLLRSARSGSDQRQRRGPRMGADRGSDWCPAAVCGRLPSLLPHDRLVRGCTCSGHMRSGPFRADTGTHCNRLPPCALPVLSRHGRAIPDSPRFRSFRPRMGLVWHENHFIRIGLVDDRAVWYISIGAIVIGHVVAVYLAHGISLRAYSDQQVALRSQWPMVALMVCYTITSLWIIAQPIVKIR